MNAFEVADAMSCRWQWFAFLHGDADPVVVAGARKYANFIFSREIA